MLGAPLFLGILPHSKARFEISEASESCGPKKILVSFADIRLSRSARRFERQAATMGFFGAVKVFSERDLEDDFKQSVGLRLHKSLPGFGYWVWKPQIILQTLLSAEEDDIVVYVDVGCHFNPAGKGRLDQYLHMLLESKIGVLAFQAKPPQDQPVWDGRWLPSFPDAQWAKGDLLDFFEVREQLEIIESPTIGAGVIFFRNCGPARQLVRTWLEVMVNNPALADDSTSKSPNHPWFIAHRHDQSVFSIIAKQHVVRVVSAFEYWYPGVRTQRPDWAALCNTPIHARRDLDFGVARNISTSLKRRARGMLLRATRLNPFSGRKYFLNLPG